MPADAVETERSCRNCGSPLAGPYCSRCGQREVDPELPLRELLSDFLSSFFDWDSRFFLTLRHLAFRPGKVTAEYLAGRRARYASPLRLYFVTSVLFLVALNWVTVPAVEFAGPHDEAVEAGEALRAAAAGGAGETAEAGGAGETTTTPDGGKAAQGAEGEEPGTVTELGWFEGRLRKGNEALERELERNPEAALERLLRAWGWAMFLLVPAFAWLLGLFFRGAERPYSHHLVFALHLHAFLFLVAASAFLLARGSPGIPRTSMSLALLLWGAIYPVPAMRRVYGQGRIVTALKAYTALGIHGWLLAVGVAAVTLAVLFLAA